MQKLAIVGMNYGSVYQSFIPFYVYSALKYQPNCSVLVFSDIKISDNVKKMLHKISHMGSFEIIESYEFGLKGRKLDSLIPEYRRAMRWLFFDDRFLDYETLYFGDIDILFCKETKGIYEQHKKHCSTIKLPYSNYIRASNMMVTYRRLAYILLHNGLRDIRRLINIFNKKYLAQNKFSGLHFIKTQEYFNKVIPQFPYFINYMTSNKQDIRLMFNESILYELIKKSNLGLPPICSTSPDLDNMHPDNIGFRPHHGIHLGIFRDLNNIVNDRQTLQSYVYQEYFENYRSNEQNSTIFNELINFANPFVKNVFKNLDKYCSLEEDLFYESI